MSTPTIAQQLEAEFHKAIAPHVTKRKQGYVMGAFRAAIRAAVGGEAVAWQCRAKWADGSVGDWSPCSQRFAETKHDIDYEYRALYAPPPTTVDVGATGPTCEAWAIVRPDGKTIHPESVRGSEHAAQWAIGEWPAMQKQGFTCRHITIVADELAALIGEKAR